MAPERLLAAACHLHALTMLMSCWVTRTLSTHTQKFRGWETERLGERDMTAWSLIDCAASHYQNKVLITVPYMYHGGARILIIRNIFHLVSQSTPTSLHLSVARLFFPAIYLWTINFEDNFQCHSILILRKITLSLLLVLFLLDKNKF